MKDKGIFFVAAILFLFYTSGFSEGQIGCFTPDSYKDPTMVYLSTGVSFDTRFGEPKLPEDLCIKDYGEEGYYIVQLSGPIYQEDQESLEATGVRIIDYLPNYAYIVKMNKPVKERVNSLLKVRWIGVFQPAYKISPDLKESGIDTVTVLLFPEENRREVVPQIEKLGGIVIREYEDKGGDILRVILELSKVKEIAHLKGVYWIEPYRTPRIFNDRTQWIMQDFYHHKRKVWDKGIKGEEQIGCVLDSGIRTTHNMFRDPKVSITTWGDYPNHRKIIAYKNAADNTFGDEGGHGTHTSCSVLGDDEPVGGTAPYDGMAKKAKIYFFDCGKGGPYIYPGNWSSNFAKAYAGGARAISNSWGSFNNRPPSYHSDCRRIDQFMWSHPECLIFWAAGNIYGQYKYVDYYAAAKNNVAVGSVEDGPTGARRYGSWSCIGPTADGRYKPTIVTPGVIASAWARNNNDYAKTLGTSMSCPIAAGTALLIRQYFMEGWGLRGKKDVSHGFEPSAALLKAVLINSAENDITSHTVPDNYVGWGRPNLDNTLYFEGDDGKLGVADNIELKTGEKCEYFFNVEGSPKSLRITLVWTDYPGSPSADKALVNDLDLEVKASNGKTYKGNVYSGGQSTTGGDFDDINVEENVRIDNPSSGEWKVTVYGRNVSRSPQKFVLVVTGGFPKGEGWLVGGIEEGESEKLAHRFSIVTPSYRPRINYQLSERTYVSILVYNSLGRRVTELVNGVQSPGTYGIFWDGLDTEGYPQPAGIYFYRIETEKFSKICKGVLLR